MTGDYDTDALSFGGEQPIQALLRIWEIGYGSDTPGNLMSCETTTYISDRQFQGQQNQTTIGLYHMGARWYDPSIGVWTQPDSMVPNPLDPLALNRYSFVEEEATRTRGSSWPHICPGLVVFLVSRRLPG